MEAQAMTTPYEAGNKAFSTMRHFLLHCGMIPGDMMPTVRIEFPNVMARDEAIMRIKASNPGHVPTDRHAGPPYSGTWFGIPYEFTVADPTAKHRRYPYADDGCPGHASDLKVCAKCGTHVDELRPLEPDTP
jgi:hypothetical protein